MVEINMDRMQGSASSLDAVGDTAGDAATEAFKQLASEHRLAILLTLWESYEPFETDHSVPFSVIRRRIGMRDKGRFNYHLDMLTGHFVERTSNGYKLRPPGLQFVQTVISGTGLSEHESESTAVDRECYLCGGPTQVFFRDGMLFWMCSECDGLFDRDDDPAGTLASAPFDPAGLTDRTPEELLNASWTGGQIYSALGGVCDVCSGPIDRWLHRCADHVYGGVCPACGWRNPEIARFQCSVCKQHFEMAPWWLVLAHPKVVAFYYEHGIPLLYEDGVEFQPRIESSLQHDLDQELVSDDPMQVQVTVQHDGDELRLVLDDKLRVVEITEER